MKYLLVMLTLIIATVKGQTRDTSILAWADSLRAAQYDTLPAVLMLADTIPLGGGSDAVEWRKGFTVRHRIWYEDHWFYEPVKFLDAQRKEFTKQFLVREFK